MWSLFAVSTDITDLMLSYITGSTQSVEEV